MRIALTAATLVLTWAPPATSQSAMAPRVESFVASTGAFTFYSDTRVNFHDLLHGWVESGETADARPGCLRGLPGDERRAFEDAAAFYSDRLGLDAPDRGDNVLDLRFHLIGYPEAEIGSNSVVAAAVDHLDAGLAAYRACWWPDHAARNRRWIAGMLPLVVAHEDSVAARLSRLFQGEWELPIAVDVAGYASRNGANTILNPDHVLISGSEGVYEAESGLEILFHEASHTLVTPRFGAVARALAEASREAGLERPPAELWHVLLFYTTGRTVQALLAERGLPDYEPYLYAEGLFDRAWPELRGPVEDHWQPYLDGAIDMDEAARRLIEAMAGA